MLRPTRHVLELAGTILVFKIASEFSSLFSQGTVSRGRCVAGGAGKPPPTHTPEYWATLGLVLPDYEERREALRRLGERLVW